MRVQYGDVLYTTKNEAVHAVTRNPRVTSPAMAETVLTTALVIQGNIVDWTDTAKFEFIPLQDFR